MDLIADLMNPATIEPIHYGPTWERNPEWDGVSALMEFVLPTHTLGWQILDWIEENLQSDEVDDEGAPLPFKPTREQSRFILWWYAIDERGRFVYRQGILQRLKGWGKDPLAAVLSAVEFIGPCRFRRWATPDDPLVKAGVLQPGEPVGVEHPRAWIQIAAVSRDQTRNTMTLFPGLFSKECMKAHGMTKDSINREIVYAHGGARRIEAVTSSPRALEGGRPTFVIANETHHWIENNEGHDMWAVIDRNVTKSKGGSARVLSITNAYQNSENSVAQQQREAWEREHAGEAISTGVFYDSLEAPPEIGIVPELPPGLSDQEKAAATKAHVAAVIRGVRGDAVWLDVETMVNTILDTKTPPAQARRFYFNQVHGSGDEWLDPRAVDAATSLAALAARANHADAADPLRAGWLVGPTEPIVIFFDASKSDDATALVGSRLSDGYLMTLGVWQRPRGLHKDTLWRVDREAVHARLVEVFHRFDVVAFWGDPSHALDDDASRYWDGMFDRWHRIWKDQLQVWAVRTGDRAHSVMWDMTSPQRVAEFTAAAEITREALRNADLTTGHYDPLIRHDGHPLLKQHLRNAVEYPNAYGISLGKKHRESKSKVDLAVAAVGADMLRRIVLNRGLEEQEPEEQPGEYWGR